MKRPDSVRWDKSEWNKTPEEIAKKYKHESIGEMIRRIRKEIQEERKQNE